MKKITINGLIKYDSGHVLRRLEGWGMTHLLYFNHKKFFDGTYSLLKSKLFHFPI